MKALTAFELRETHGILSRPGNETRKSSDGLSWTSLYASAQQESPFSAEFPAVQDQLIVLHTDGPVEIGGAAGSTTFRRTVPAGGIHLIPGGADFTIRLSRPLRSLHAYIRRSVIVDVASQMTEGDPERIEICPCILDGDKPLQLMMDAVRDALEDNDCATPLYVDYLSQTMAAQLVRRHSGAQIRARRSYGARGKLTPTVSDAIDYMRENLDQPVKLAEIASAVNRSASHLTREFRASTGQPPHQFLIELRVDHARELLERSQLPIAQIAFECGFSHQEHMTRQFRRHCGTTPAAFRKMRCN